MVVYTLIYDELYKISKLVFGWNNNIPLCGGSSYLHGIIGEGVDRGSSQLHAAAAWSSLCPIQLRGTKVFRDILLQEQQSAYIATALQSAGLGMIASV